ncbi:MAG: DegT/DnrJ/EryC1/StrS aminotransferase family protein [Bacteroidetes bacterium]|nr:DegT/DnrJ/EryC1/StrS aminotransferase family protein [Bacteroidota bacterium]
MTGIKMVDLQAQYVRYQSDIDANVLAVMRDGAFIHGPQVAELERALALRYNVRHVIGCANGTDALQLAFMALELPRGSEVITPSFSYAALAEVLLLLGLKPVFVEVNPVTFLVDLGAIKNAITPNTRAIAPVHLFGQMASMGAIMELAHQHNLFVVEDTAQSMGSQYCFNGEHGFAGTIGHIGTTSFFPSKNLGCFGDGGAIFTQDDSLASKLRMLANHGQKVKYQHDVVGLNSRLDTLQASILLAKLPHLFEFEQSRNAVAKRYNLALKNCSRIAIPEKNAESSHVYHQYTLICESHALRESLKAYLGNNEIPSMVYYPIPLHKQKAYAQHVDLPITDDLCKRVLSLPICPELQESHQDKTIKTIQEYLEQSQ